MKIEKIEKISKEIKEYLNNIDAMGVYYQWTKKHKPVEIQLCFKRFFKLFKNNIKKAYLNITYEKHPGELLEYNEPVDKFINNYLYYISDKYEYSIYYKIGDIKYFALLSNIAELKEIRKLKIWKLKK